MFGVSISTSHHISARCQELRIYYQDHPDIPADSEERSHPLRGVFQCITKKRRFTRLFSLAPQVGLEPTTLRLTAECSAIELLRNEEGRKKVTGR